MILGIETSCDDTSAAVVDLNGRILSNIVSNQDASHEKFGGVVPELASREHLGTISGAVTEALHQAGIVPAQLTAIAVTNGPGLIGSLLVGVHFAKALGLALRIPVYPVHHFLGHVVAGIFQEPALSYPLLALVVSGGHTHLYFIKDLLDFELLGKTRDDAAGEAFDKTARVLGLGFPGGPAIEKAAREGIIQEKLLPKPQLPNFDYSFSGLKTAVSYLVRDMGQVSDQERKNIAATFQHRVVSSLIDKLAAAQEQTQAKTLLICGGVSRNEALREHARQLADRLGVSLRLPLPSLCTDNAAMIAATAWLKQKRNLSAPTSFETFSHSPLHEHAL